MDAAHDHPEQFALLLRELQDAMGEGNIAMARRLGMTITDAAAIEHISLAQTPLGPAELSTRLGVTRSSATEIVDRLVAAGHIERQRDEQDRRRYRLVPTVTAQRLVGREISPLLAAITSAAATLGTADRAVVAGFLAAVTDAHREFARADVPGPQA